MTLALTAALAVAMVGTSFISGIFGMAGGMILIGLLLGPAAAAGHGAARGDADGLQRLARGPVARPLRWRAVGNYLLGCLVALAVWSF